MVRQTRRDAPSRAAERLGDWSYEISDTKLARETRAGTILQLGLYSEMLGRAQGARPGTFPRRHAGRDEPVHTFRVDDYAAYFRLVRGQMIETVRSDATATIAAEYYPGARRALRDLSVVAGLSSTSGGRTTISRSSPASRARSGASSRRDGRDADGLAQLPLPITFKPQRGSAESYERVREQARLQLESRDKTPPLHELLAD